jgi:hypothetical protein
VLGTGQAAATTVARRSARKKKKEEEEIAFIGASVVDRSFTHTAGLPDRG